MRDFGSIAESLKRSVASLPRIGLQPPGPDYLFAFAGGVCWILFFGIHGAEITPDSALHMKYARNMRYAGDFFVDPIVPPLYPVIFHLLLYAIPHPADAGTLLSGLCLLAGLLLFVRLLRLGGSGAWWNVLFTAALASGSGVLRVYTFVWTEPLYAVFFMSALVFAALAWERRRPEYFIPVALFASAAAMTRYVGYSLIAILIAWGALYSLTRRSPGRRALFLPVGAMLAACVPSLLWVIRNRRASGTPHGERVYEISPVGPYVRELADTLAGDFGAAGLALLIAATVLFSVRTVSELRETRRVSSPWIALLPVLAVIYYALLLRSKSTIYISSPITSRYAFPAYFPMAAFVCLSFARGIAPSGSGMTGAARWQTAAFFATFILVQSAGLLRSLDTIKDRAGSEADHAAPGFDRSRSCEEIGAYLSAAFAESDEVHVASAYQWQKGKTDPRMADTLFYRGSLYRRIGARGVRIVRDAPHDFTVEFGIDGRPKRLVYLDIGRVRSIEELEGRVGRRARDCDGRSLHLFVALKPGGDLIDPLAKRERLLPGPQSVTDLSGYRVWEFGAAGD